MPQISEAQRSPRMDGTSGASVKHVPGHDGVARPEGQHRADVGTATPSDTRSAQGLISNPAATVLVTAREESDVIPAPSLASRLLRIRQDARVQRSPLPPGLWAVAQTVQAWEDFGLADRMVDVDEVIDPRLLAHHVEWFDPNTRHVLHFAMGRLRQWHVSDFSALYTDRFDPRGSFLDQFDVLPSRLRDIAVPNALLDCLGQPLDRKDARRQAHYDYARNFFCTKFAPAMGIADVATMRIFSFHVARDAGMAKAVGDYLQRACEEVTGQPVETEFSAPSKPSGRSADRASIAGVLEELARCIDTDRAWQNADRALRTNIPLLLATTVRGHWSRNPWRQRAWIVTLIEKLPLCRSRHLIHEMGFSMVTAGFLQRGEWNALNDLLPLESENDMTLFREQVSLLRSDAPGV